MGRLLGLIGLTSGLGLFVLAFLLWRADREHLRTWHRVQARVDSVRVVQVPMTMPYTLGGHGVRLAYTVDANGERYSAAFTDPAWARLSYRRAQRDADEALARGTLQVLIDPADPGHISINPDRPLRFYRDAWQLALLATLFAAVGLVARRAAAPGGMSSRPAARPPSRR